MGSIAKAMTANQRAAAAAYYSALLLVLPAAAAVGAEMSAQANDGAWLVRRGRWSDQVPACVSCHGPAGEGVGELFPPIASLPEGYMQQQIQAWKDGTRPPGSLELMKVIAQKLSADDMATVAAHFASLQLGAAKSSNTVPAAADSAVTQAAVPAGASASVAHAPQAAANAAFVVPNASAIPNTPMDKVIRRGEQIFINTQANAPKFVGNALNCVSCHLDAGRLAGSAPMWSAYPVYPAYRNKTKHVDSFVERLRGCFVYSMNGKAPPDGGDALVALEAYSYWMAQGAAIGEKLPGAGYPKQPAPSQKPDFSRSAAVFEVNCALCHSADGQGQRGQDPCVSVAVGPEVVQLGRGHALGRQCRRRSSTRTCRLAWVAA